MTGRWNAAGSSCLPASQLSLHQHMQNEPPFLLEALWGHKGFWGHFIALEHSFTILNYYRGYGYYIFIFMTSCRLCPWFIWTRAFVQEHNLQLNVVTVAKTWLSLEWPSLGLFPKTHYGEKWGLPIHVHEHFSLWSLGFPIWRIRGD